MGEEGLPSIVIGFVADHIHSIHKLEVLLLLHERRDKAWTAEMVSNELRAGKDLSQRSLNEFTNSGLIVSDKTAGTFQYQPRTPELHAKVERLVESHRKYRLRIYDLIYAAPPSCIRAFTESFRLRKDDDENG